MYNEILVNCLDLMGNLFGFTPIFNIAAVSLPVGELIVLVIVF
jgi:hypothetical protein